MLFKQPFESWLTASSFTALRLGGAECCGSIPNSSCISPTVDYQIPADCHAAPRLPVSGPKQRHEKRKWVRVCLSNGSGEETVCIIVSVVLLSALARAPPGVLLYTLQRENLPRRMDEKRGTWGRASGRDISSKGSGQTIAFISCQCAQQNIQRKAKCAELELFGKGMFCSRVVATNGKGLQPLEKSFRKKALP